jgi:hypothetical protein
MEVKALKTVGLSANFSPLPNPHPALKGLVRGPRRGDQENLCSVKVML